MTRRSNDYNLQSPSLAMLEMSVGRFVQKNHRSNKAHTGGGADNKCPLKMGSG